MIVLLMYLFDDKKNVGIIWVCCYGYGYAVTKSCSEHVGPYEKDSVNGRRVSVATTSVPNGKLLGIYYPNNKLYKIYSKLHHFQLHLCTIHTLEKTK